MRRILAQVIAKMGHKTLEAGDGVEAWQVLQKYKDIDLLLTDWNMPNMDGLELVKHIRQDNNLNNLKIIMITANTGRAEVITALRNGANNYIAKPFSSATLKQKLKEVIDV